MRHTNLGTIHFLLLRCLSLGNASARRVARRWGAESGQVVREIGQACSGRAPSAAAFDRNKRLLRVQGEIEVALPGGNGAGDGAQQGGCDVMMADATDATISQRRRNQPYGRRRLHYSIESPTVYVGGQ
jgi:hypothetical protein